jgi:hypothetical protein
MTTKELIVGSALLVAAPFVATVATSSVAQAQGYYHHHWYGHGYRGLYNYSGSGLVSPPNRDRGGPGPRVLDGAGMGIGAVR